MLQKLANTVRSHYKSLYTEDPEYLIAAPGRINLIGEHTDYNDGFVFPAAVDRHMVFALGKNQSNACRIKAIDLEQEVLISLNHLTKHKYSWANYFVGILRELNKLGNSVSGFNCLFSSNIPMGGGMSSSSALECGFIKGLSELFNFDLGNLEMIEISKASNHGFLGLQGGIMDQFACIYGKSEHAILLDCRDLSYSYHPVELPQHQWVLINSGVEHDLITTAYNDRVASCQAVVSQLAKSNSEIKSLRDVTADLLARHKNDLSSENYKRAHFVINENARVHKFANALKENRIEQLGNLLYASHEGLQNEYEVSCPELDVLIHITRSIPEVVGARMMGGGFGGCTINLIKKINSTEIVERIMNQYEEQTGIHPESFIVNLEDGLHIL